MKWLSDPTRRFTQRPLFTEFEIQERVDNAVTCALGEHRLGYTLSDNDLDLLADFVTEHYDPESELSSRLGSDVEGVTIFRPGQKPRIKISASLLSERYAKRRRMTIAHEIGHAVLHSDLYPENETLDLFSDSTARGTVYCKASTMLPGVDWMEWQASYAAGCLLMPASAVGMEMDKLLGERAARAIYPYDKEAEQSSEHVAEFFEVSRDAARVRLMQLGFIEDPIVQRLPLY